jgi:hypothetical protein
MMNNGRNEWENMVGKMVVLHFALEAIKFIVNRIDISCG